MNFLDLKIRWYRLTYNTRAIIFILAAFVAGLSYGLYQKYHREQFQAECTRNGDTVLEVESTRGLAFICLPAGR